MTDVLRTEIEDIVYSWSLSDSRNYHTLIEQLHQFVLDKYGPPF